MSDALQGTPPRGVTLTEQANGRRIGRSMFIGHTVGYIILFVGIALATEFLWARLTGDGSFELGFYDLWTDYNVLPPFVHVDLLTGNHVLKGILLGASVFVWSDLIVRRRHDRNRSGIEGVLWLLLLVADQVLAKLQATLIVAQYLDYVIYAGALYLFIVLVLLPGNRQENRYGAAPRPD